MHGNFAAGASCSMSKIVTECEVFTSPDVLRKEKNVVYPFHVFEKGSTSGTSNESSATSFETILADGTLQPYQSKRTMAAI
ncbi:uncharacterized protein LOC107802945 isoform X2 [Nicotiana tabacum]|uniref:Uncharacterized protein LOC107802945 isoform X2 n=1 Tax=Nicotiana tabacum TaxID=4097 RepID=A0AC58U5V9_TOBAC